jgi:DNA (cytosine-5)-methyltransferase 1
LKIESSTISGRSLRLLDLFCGAGGCAVGYHRAGFAEIVGVDVKPQPRYPFAFVQGDALEYLAAHGGEFDAIHASPPCQAYSWASAKHRNTGTEYPDLLEPTIAALESAGAPWVVENVVGASMGWSVTLCGAMFGLRVYRHRVFTASFLMTAPRHPRHRERCAPVGCPPKGGEFVTVAGHFGRLATARAAMGIDWMNHKELSQAIPPAYTEFIGKQLAAHVRAG